MKKLILTLFSIVVFSGLKAQNYTKYLADARSSYSANKLDDARFAMQQLLQELDIQAGKDILKILPVKLEELNTNTANDNVSGNSGFAGIMIQRDYGSGNKTAEIQIIGNSPLLASVNAILALPFGNANGNQKTIKIDGYKALLQKNTDSETNTTSYEIQVPLTSSLLTLSTKGLSEEEIRNLAKNIPIAEISKHL